MTTPEELEAQAGDLLVQAAHLRLERSNPDDQHEIRHIHAAIRAGVTDDGPPHVCGLIEDEEGSWVSFAGRDGNP